MRPRRAIPRTMAVMDRPTEPPNVGASPAAPPSREHPSIEDGSPRSAPEGPSSDRGSIDHIRLGGWSTTTARAAPPPTDRRSRPTLLGELARVLRTRHYSPRTEDAYAAWVRRFVRYHGGRHPRTLGEREVEAFLSHLAVHDHVAPPTQNQALAALLFLYREVLDAPLALPEHAVRAKARPHVPVVLSRAEVWRVIGAMSSAPAGRTPALVATLLYGAGLRLSEALSLRVKDVDLARGELTVRAGKGAKDRCTVLPEVAGGPLREHLARVRTLHGRDLARGFGRVALPHALTRKLPEAGRDWRWQWVFPARRTRTPLSAAPHGPPPPRSARRCRCRRNIRRR
jgi:integrase